MKTIFLFAVARSFWPTMSRHPVSANNTIASIAAMEPRRPSINSSRNLRPPRLTFLGESHDDAVAHYLEEQILRRTWDPHLGRPSLEMFERDVQYVLDEYLAGFITEAHLTASGRAWKNYKADYRPMIEFAKEKKMPVVAANAPRRYVNRVSRLGSAALTELEPEALRFLRLCLTRRPRRITRRSSSAS